MPALLALAALLAARPAAGWAPESRVRMADEAVRLMPRSLRLALERYREPLLRGLLEPQTREDRPEHMPPWLDGTLDREIDARARALVESVEQAMAFETIADRFGALAHFVMDAGFPPGATADGSARYAHFAAFCESRRERFPLVFYGHDDPHLERGDFVGFADATMREARDNDRKLARAYRMAGRPPSPAAFDDRSVPFAVGSLSYSRTVTRVARAWLRAWESAHGDLGRTPYRKRPAGRGSDVERDAHASD